MRNKIFSAVLFLNVFIASDKPGNLPIKEWTSGTDTPFVLYISGDAGFNEFSNRLCQTINKSGYSVSAINSKTYFWDKKTPEQTAADITAYLQKLFQSRKNQQLVLSGFSFGADVMPFVVNRLPAAIKSRIISVILVSPATTTDFEIHWLEMLGINSRRSMDVIAEINKMGPQKTVVLLGNDEKTFPLKNVQLKNFSNENLPGGHHFDGHADELARTMMKYFK